MKSALSKKTTEHNQAHNLFRLKITQHTVHAGSCQNVLRPSIVYFKTLYVKGGEILQMQHANSDKHGIVQSKTFRLCEVGSEKGKFKNA